MLRPRLAATDTRRVAQPKKTADKFYHTPDHRAWRDAVLERAGHRCEGLLPDGTRCTKAAPVHRLFADHRVELKDGGAALDLSNGQCLCGAHHTAKTAAARAARRFD